MKTIRQFIGREAKVQIISAIIWAAVMILSSIILQDTEHASDVLQLLILGASMQMLLLSRPGVQINAKQGNQPSEEEYIH